MVFASGKNKNTELSVSTFINSSHHRLALRENFPPQPKNESNKLQNKIKNGNGGLGTV